MNGRPERSNAWRGALLDAVTATAIAAATVAVAFLLLGAFGETEGRILATTALLGFTGSSPSRAACCSTSTGGAG